MPEYPLSDSELRKLQNILLEMLIELDRVCKKYDIRYCIIAGTLLGAVRHKGFIPWDDDLDVAMVRSEYNRFREVCVTELDTSRFFFQDDTTDEHYRWGWGRLRRIDSEFVRVGQEHLKMRAGIFLDVFPMDGVPDFPPLRGLFTAYCFFLRKILYAEVGRISAKKSLSRIMYGALSKIPVKIVFRHLERLQRYGVNRETKYARKLTFPTPQGRPFGYLSKWYVDIGEIEFEGRMFPCIREYDEYLSYKFGDYMKLPPPELRHWHPVSEFRLPKEVSMNLKNTPNHKWIYTYDYAPEQIWEPWRTMEVPPAWINFEAQNVSERANAYISNKTLSFVLITDSHYVINGTWPDTRKALSKLNKKISLDGIIHLGDFTDGMVSRNLTAKYVRDVFADFEKIGLNCYATLGNHDCNYFRNNPERLNLNEQRKMYLQGNEPRYYIDYEQKKLRLIFIDSYDVNESLRYGFSNECLDWLNQVLTNVPSHYSTVIFSHLTPLVKLQAWTKEIRNSDAIMEVLNKHSEKIIAYINGHNHCDHLYNDGGFPIISINCAKCEYFTEHKPAGAVVPERMLGDVSQESFDIMTIDTEKREIHFTRFGAGSDRIVSNGKAGWL